MSAKVNVLPEFRNDSRENLASTYESGNKTIFSNLEIENLLPIKEESGKVVISARDLHRFLCIGKDFSTWIKDRIEKYRLVENEDYVVFPIFGENPKGGRPTIEYAIPLDVAKELCMVENNEQGRKARKYFIECERKLNKKDAALPKTYLESLKELVVALEEKEKLEKENAIMKPKAEYFDNLVDRNLLTNFRDTAKQIGLTQNSFIKLLLDNGYLYRDSHKKLKPYAEYAGDLFEIKDFEKNGFTSTQTLITPRGKETFRLLWGNKE